MKYDNIFLTAYSACGADTVIRLSIVEKHAFGLTGGVYFIKTKEDKI